jgi:cytochrome P450
MPNTVLKKAMTPGLVAFVASQRLRNRPYGLYRAGQRIDPFHISSIGVWIVTSHAGVAAALREPLLGSDERKADLSLLNFGVFQKLLGRQASNVRKTSPFIQMFSELMLFRDPPDHTRLRALVAKAFTPRRVEALGPRIQQLTDEILDEASTNGRMDLMKQLAYPLPARVICELVGVPAEDVPLVVKHAPALAIGLDPGPMRPQEAVDRADRATLELVEYMSGLIETRRRSPGEDMLSALIAAEQDGETLSQDELIATVLLLLLAGHETTANLVGNGLRALHRDQAALARLRDDPSVDKTAADELLRYDTPVQMTVRTALDDVEVDGHLIDKGRQAVLVFGAANRDPNVFEDPARLDLARTPNPHLAFGGGAHFCIGAPLARLEGRIVLTSLVRRFPKLRVVATERRKSFTIRGFSRLEIAWS